ncbi:MAG: SulP family inorganic anion transporter, partial [Jaaginema sp. PMC 1078.18]|nr:SulP family inorganic anion transporter [Jaaginema sp. PMC 1078.18]
LWTLGRFKGGDAIRFIPYPVVGGFMAGTGWLLMDGFFQVTTSVSLTWGHLPVLIAPEILSHWGVGFAIALTLLIASNRFKHYLIMPGTLLSAIALFYGVLYALGIPLDQAREQGWLLGPFPSGGLWQPLQLSDFGAIHWLPILHQSGAIITVMLISLLSLVLSNSGIELVVGQDINLNSELQGIGLACFASGCGSGMVGNQALPSTLLVNDIGGKSRLTGLIAAIPCFAVLLLGSAFLAYLPKPVLGALLLYLGLSLLIQWLYKAWFKLPLADYLTVIAILVVINAVGFLQGVLVGFVLATLLFMYDYSRVNVARKVLSGKTTRSNVERTAPEKEILTQKGEQTLILELRGYLFFGTANYLLNQVRSRVDQDALLPLRYVIIDFRQVTGLDSSAVLSFDKILKIARKRDFQLIFTNLDATFQAELERGGAFQKESHLTQVFPDIDRGLEWCEKQLLQNRGEQCLTNIASHLAPIFANSEDIQAFQQYLHPKQIAAGETVFQKGKPDAHLYFLECGQVSVLLELPDGKTKRLQTARPGSILGEMRFYGKTPLSTSVVADTDCQLYFLTHTDFTTMKTAAPHLATQLEGYIVELLCDSLLRREQQLQIIR